MINLTKWLVIIKKWRVLRMSGYNFSKEERKEMINLIHNQFKYSISFLESKSNEELYTKILRNELIAKYNPETFKKQQFKLHDCKGCVSYKTVKDVVNAY
jgi:hypothetical protein